MEEKYMVNDVLEGATSDIVKDQNMHTETENIQLRQTLQQMRNNSESFQYEVFKIAQNKDYYIPAQAATPQEISKVKTELNV